MGRRVRILSITGVIIFLATLLLVAGCANPLKEIIEKDAAEKLPEINVKQGSTNILSGASFSFDDVPVNFPAVSLTFIIENEGNETLYLTDDPRVAIKSGVFYVGNQPISTIEPGMSENFTIEFDPGEIDKYSAAVIIENDDPNEETYSFTITGSGKPKCIFVKTEADGGDDGNEGSPGSPMATIQAAIAAIEPDPGEIRVAAGTYVISVESGEIQLQEDVSLYGGYSVIDWNDRNIGAYITTITDSRTSAGDIYVISCGSSITATTVIDGFTINAGGNVNSDSHGIYIDGGSPAISNNIISGGNGFLAYGIYCDNGSDPEITGNTIYAGTLFLNYGIYNSGGSPIITNNTINGGGNELGKQYGIYYNGSNAVICNNIIIGGDYTSSSISYGIYESSSTSLIVNNTIDGGCANNSSGIRISDSISVTIKNNIIVSSGVNYGYGIYENNSDSDPNALQNNCIFNCITALYRDEGNTSLTDIEDLNDYNNTTQNASYLSEGNVTGNTGIFEDFAGGEWHLVSGAPSAIRIGGLNGWHSSEDWSAWFPVNPGGNPCDRDGNNRTPYDDSATTGWSMGAYEY